MKLFLQTSIVLATFLQDVRSATTANISLPDEEFNDAALNLTNEEVKDTSNLRAGGRALSGGKVEGTSVHQSCMYKYMEMACQYEIMGNCLLGP